MNDFVQRMNDVADDNPQKLRLRAELNISFDRHCQVAIERNDVKSLELLIRVVEELIEKLQNKSFLTRIKTETSKFQTQLKALVVSNSCEQRVSELAMAARCIDEHADADTYKKATIAVGVAAAVATGAIAAPVVAVAAKVGATAGKFGTEVVVTAKSIAGGKLLGAGAAVGVVAVGVGVGVAVSGHGDEKVIDTDTEETKKETKLSDLTNIKDQIQTTLTKSKS